VFFVVGLFSLDDYGITYDEIVSFRSGQRYLNQLASFQFSFDPGASSDQSLEGYQVLDGYYFVMDATSAAFVELLSAKLGLVEEAKAYHLFHHILSSMSVLLVYAIALAVRGSVGVASLSALTLALMPQFIGHSQNNPKDLPALFACTLLVASALRVGQRGRWRDVVGGAIALGIALTTRVLSPIFLAIPTVWLLVARRRELLERRRAYLFFVVLGGAAALVFWPALWADPVGRLLQSGESLSSFSYTDPVLYLGEIYSGDAVPWHYTLVHVLATTPVTFCLLASIALLGLASEARRGSRLEPLTLLGAMWVALPLILESMVGARYDAARHVLVILPGLAMLVAAGAETGQCWLVRARKGEGGLGWPRAAYAGLITAGYVVVVGSLISIHPYASAYLNELTNAMIRGDSDEQFAVEYWGHAYKEGVEWLLPRISDDDELFVPIAPHLPGNYMKKAVSHGSLNRFRDQSRRRYLMFITRRSEYNRLIRAVEREYEPVFSIRRQKATLLKIYRNDTMERRERATDADAAG
jgi:hypothetical protein